jgi:predicted Holliday junction resolvase-like endonuclease
MDNGLTLLSILLLGIVIGAVIVGWILRNRRDSDHTALRATLRGEMGETFAAKSEVERTRIVRAYEGQIQNLENQHRLALAHARYSSVNQSRAVLKGKMAEQVAPLLPGFAYWPADARFLGDPIDYIVFDGYSACKDNKTDGRDIEIVLLDIKYGKSVLTREQRRVADAVSAGRVRFEVVRVFPDGTVRSRTWGARESQEPHNQEEDMDEGYSPGR